MKISTFELVAAAIVGVIALFVLKLLGLVIKFAFIIALLLTLAGWLVFRSISRTFSKRR